MSKTGEDVVEIEEVEAEEYTEAEVQAMDHGWAPKDEWRGDADDWISAKRFIKNGELFGKIKSLERDKDQMRSEFAKAGKAMTDMLVKARDTEYKRAVKELKVQKRQALVDEETSVVMDLDDEIEELKNDYQEEKKVMEAAPVVTAAPAMSQQFVDWTTKNTWYDNDSEMRMDADAAGMVFAQKNPSATEAEVYAHVDKSIKRMYPDKFENPRKNTPDKVSETTTGAKRGRKKSKYSASDLNAEQATIMKTMTRTGVMSEDEYIAELARIGEIGA